MHFRKLRIMHARLFVCLGHGCECGWLYLSMLWISEQAYKTDQQRGQNSGSNKQQCALQTHPCNENRDPCNVMKTGFSLWEKLHRENPIFITGMGLQCTYQYFGQNFAYTFYYFLKRKADVQSYKICCPWFHFHTGRRPSFFLELINICA